MGNQNASLDVSAKTVDEAIARGLNQLGLTRDEVDIEIINEGKRGIFGIGAEDAVVRLIVKQVEEPEPAAPPAPEIPEPAVVEPESQPEPPVIEAAAEPEVPADAAIEDAPAPPVADTPAPQPEIEAEPVDDEDEQEEAVPSEADKDPIEIAKNHLEHILEYLGIEAAVEVHKAPALAEDGEAPPTVLDITGNDLGILIGRRSETLQALQYLVRLMVSKEMQSWQRITIDVESYRSRRRRSLENMAKRMAERAVANQERVVLEAMTAYERRLVHIALRDHPAVYTKSIGRDNNRKVTIIPK